MNGYQSKMRLSCLGTARNNVGETVKNYEKTASHARNIAQYFKKNAFYVQKVTDCGKKNEGYCRKNRQY